MSLLPFLVVTSVGAVLALLTRRAPRVAAAIGLVALAAGVVTAAGIEGGERLVVGGGGLVTSDFLRLFVLLGAVCGLLLAVVGTAAGGNRRDGSAVTLALLATSAVALALPDARSAVLAATAGGVVGSLLAITGAGGRVGATVGLRALQAAVLAGTLALAASAWVGRDLSELTATPSVIGLAYLAMAVAVAIRFGAIPFHAWAARLTDAVPECTLPLITAWAPAAFAVVALAWVDPATSPLVDVDAVRAVIVFVGVVTILLGALAAAIQDEVEHIVGYSIIGDAGVIMLAIGALDPAAWEPARTFILAFVVARSAFAAWAAAARTTFYTGRLDDMRGWIRRSPTLGLVLVVIALASLGLPGLAAFEARADIVRLALPGPLAAVMLVGVLSPIVAYARLLLGGLRRPEPGRARIVAGTRVVLTPLDVTHGRAWLARTWETNRPFTATIGALVLALAAMGTAAGAFGGPAAAAGPPPTIDGPSGSFQPVDPGASADPAAPPDAAASAVPSFAPVPTP